MVDVAALPARVSSKQLAALWHLTLARVGQFSKAGRIKKGEDNLFDLKECLAFRSAQMDGNEIKMLFQSYGNRHGVPSTAPKIIEQRVPMSDDDLLYGEEDDEPAEQPSSDAMTEAMRRNRVLTEMRMRSETLKIERAEQRIAREAGELIPRSEVYRISQNAAATVQRLLRTLEHELPVIFAKREDRPDVRLKVQGVVDRCLHAMTKQLDQFGDDHVAAPTSSEPEDD